MARHRTPVEYPPPPWTLRGRGWAGLFPLDGEVGLPEPWRPALGHEAVVVVNRYREPLVYDELLMGVPVRHGMHVALWVNQLWVSAPAAKDGGREIWALPKALGEFTWSEGGVSVRDEDGAVASLGLPAKRALAPAPVMLPVLSRDAAGLLLTRARGWSRMAKVQLQLVDAPRLPLRTPATSRLAFALPEFRLTFPAPERLDAQADRAER